MNKKLYQVIYKLYLRLKILHYTPSDYTKVIYKLYYTTVVKSEGVLGGGRHDATSETPFNHLQLDWRKISLKRLFWAPTYHRRVPFPSGGDFLSKKKWLPSKTLSMKRYETHETMAVSASFLWISQVRRWETCLNKWLCTTHPTPNQQCQNTIEAAHLKMIRKDHSRFFQQHQHASTWHAWTINPSLIKKTQDTTNSPAPLVRQFHLPIVQMPENQPTLVTCRWRDDTLVIRCYDAGDAASNLHKGSM